MDAAYPSRAGRPNRPKDIDESLGEAISLLNSNETELRLQAVQSLVSIADTYAGEYRQKVVDTLCGYLRSVRLEDAEVELDIMLSMREHLRTNRFQDRLRNKYADTGYQDMLSVSFQTMAAEQLWCDCDFDFHGAEFSSAVVLEFADFGRGANFSDVVFKGGATFNCTIFGEGTSFRNAVFLEKAAFILSFFERNADFTKTIFICDVEFNAASFDSGLEFNDATFRQAAAFIATGFEADAHMRNNRYGNIPNFENTIFASV